MNHNKKFLKGNYYHNDYLRFAGFIFGFLGICYIIISHTLPNFNTLSYYEIALTITTLLAAVLGGILRFIHLINTTTQIRLTDNGFYIIYKLKKEDRIILLNNIEKLILKISVGSENNHSSDDDVKIFIKNERYPIQFGSALLSKKDWVIFIEYLIQHKVNYLDKGNFLETYRKHYQ